MSESLTALVRMGRSVGAPITYDPGSRLRLVALAATVAVLVLTVASWVAVWPQVLGAWGADYDFFLMVANRWLTSGQFYAPHQLAGPYEAAINVDTLYPPVALFLFLPFIWLPAFLWWAVPLSIIVWSVVHWRPAPWVWPFLAVMVWWPRTQSSSSGEAPGCGSLPSWPSRSGIAGPGR